MGSAPVKSTSLTPKPATQHTIDANQVYRDGLPFSDDQDFKDASRGWKASLPDPAVITNGQAHPSGTCRNTSSSAVAPRTTHPIRSIRACGVWPS